MPFQAYYCQKLIQFINFKTTGLGDAHFECKVVPVGDPDMEVTWLLDDKPLGIANRIHTIFEFGYCSLDIVNCYKCDTGIITCRATNKYGTQETSGWFSN